MDIVFKTIDCTSINDITILTKDLLWENSGLLEYINLDQRLVISDMIE